MNSSRHITIIFLFICIAIFATSVSVHGQQPLTPTDMWKLQRVGTPNVSPDGEKAVFTVTTYDIDESKGSSDIYMLYLDGSEPFQFTRHPASDSSPVWSPDNKKVAFVSRRDGDRAQIYVIPVDGGEARQITDLPVAVSTPQWFPDGKRIAFVASVYPEYDGDFEKLQSMIDDTRTSKITAKVTENRIYRFWDRWLTDGMYPRLFSVDIETSEVVDLMPGTSMYFSMMGGAQYDISPDGTEIAVAINSTEPPYDSLNYDIYLLKTDGSGELKNITEHNPADDSNPRYSPDGDIILYGKQRSTHFYADNVRLVRYDRRTGERTVLTDDIDMSFQQWTWSEDGRTVYFHAEDRGKKSIFSIPANGGRVTEILRSGTNDGVQLAANNRLVFAHQSFSQPTALFEINRNGRGLKQITYFNKAILDNVRFGEVKDVTYKGANDADVQMYIVYPPDFDESHKWPLVHMIHGGPHSIFGDFFHYRWNAHLFAAPGYVVALPNFHGSTSFGQEFAESIHGSHSDKPLRDIMKATDFMLERGYIDESRMAATGGSYGGYMVSWIAGHTDRFAALVNHAGVYNIMGQFASDITAHREYSYNGSPWDGLDEMQKWNPALHAKNFVTPMLVIHGELDYRVPVTQGLEVYGVYKGKGVDARLVYFPNENHWILSPQNSIFWYDELYNWLKRYIGTGPLE
jgi:dipeptidyl aminopeptidase/acylaminoacyl peptidase